MATMYDAAYAENIPTDAELVAGYIDEGYEWSTADWDRFPHAVKVRIAVDPSLNDGDVLDIEPGNWGPADAPAWVAMRRAAGHPNPVVYTMADWWDEGRAAFHAQHVPEPLWWIADWDGDPHVPGGAVAKQYADGSMLGAGYDLSVTVDGWPDQMHSHEEDDMDADDKKTLTDLKTFLSDHYTAPYAPDDPDNQYRWAGTAVQSTWNQAYTAAQNTAAILQAVQALSDGQPVEVDTSAIVSGVLAGLDPAAIAAAIPDDLASQVADELGARLSEGTS